MPIILLTLIFSLKNKIPSTNPAKIITFPKYKEQLDYIILSDNLNCDYQKIDATTEKISDHDILTATINNLESLPSESF